MKRFTALLLILVAVCTVARADPPGRVARLALVEGEVSIFSDPGQGWEPARINSHITSENSLWTEPGARAELRVGPTALRVAEATQLDISRLDDESLLAYVARGSVSVRLQMLETGESVVFTAPGARFLLRSNGRYRIDADPEAGSSRLSVLSGNARLEVAGGFISVDTGRSVTVADDGAGFRFLAATMTDLDEWAAARDRHYAEREAARYVSPHVTGWEDLDDYGTWRNEPEYGPVWYPTQVAAGWAPYRYGRWTWVRPWGWAWVDDAPWGYAPFHYGRWVQVGSRWGWYPGRYAGRPVWAPALVGWVGQPGWNIAVTAGPLSVVGWYPLSPYERYQPWYAANVTYVNRVNRIVVVDRRDRHGERDHGRDRRGPRADNRDRGATVVARDSFGSRRPVQGSLAPVQRDVVARQPIVSGAVVLPSHDEWQGRNRPAAAPRVSGATAPSSPATAPHLKPVTPSAQPSVKPEPTYPQPVHKPVPGSAPTHTKPVPAPSPTYAKPVPAPAQPLAKPVTAPAQPIAKPVPAPSPAYAKPVPAPAPAYAKPVPYPAPGQPTANKPAPAPAAPLAKPGGNGAGVAGKPAPAASQPVVKPAVEPDVPASTGSAPMMQKPAKQ